MTIGKNGDYYLRRKIDDELTERAKRWITSSDQNSWISLRSAPGRGNSRLLRNFRAIAEELHYTLAEARVIVMDGGMASANREPQPLLPAACAIFEAYQPISHPGVAMVWRRLKTVMILALAMGSATLLVLVKALLRESNRGLTDTTLWLDLLAQFRQNPVRWVEILMLEAVVAALCEFIVHRARYGFAGHNRHREARLDECRVAEAEGFR